jgi:colicin import membrane protein
VSRSGEVLSANVVKSSGDSFFDKSAELAVQKASPLPFPSDPKYYEFINEFDLLFKPDDF